MPTTKVLPCRCPNSFQDKTYAFNYRLHNKTIKEGVWRCTGCGAEHSEVGSTTSKKTKGSK